MGQQTKPRRMDALVHHLYQPIALQPKKNSLLQAIYWKSPHGMRTAPIAVVGMLLWLGLGIGMFRGNVNDILWPDDVNMLAPSNLIAYYSIATSVTLSSIFYLVGQFGMYKFRILESVRWLGLWIALFTSGTILALSIFTLPYDHPYAADVTRTVLVWTTLTLLFALSIVRAQIERFGVCPMCGGGISGTG
mgnify:CR=1 FL=1